MEQLFDVKVSSRGPARQSKDSLCIDTKLLNLSSVVDRQLLLRCGQ